MVALVAGSAINDGKFGMVVRICQDSKGEHVYMKLVITNVRIKHVLLVKCICSM